MSIYYLGVLLSEEISITLYAIDTYDVGVRNVHLLSNQ